MLGAAMPETAVYKNRQFEFREDEIRLAKDLLATTPTSDPVLSENPDKREFGLLVAMPANLRHDQRAFLYGEDVRHRQRFQKGGEACADDGFRPK